MSAPAYSLEAWRRFKEGRDQTTDSQGRNVTLADIPPDAEMDEGIVLGCWNGERFVSWEKWLATAPLEKDVPTEAEIPIQEDATCITAICGTTRIWLVREGDRWLMFAGSRSARRRDFVSPFRSHAQRTAEAWYGAPEKGWLAGATK
jgi:hypothetical protein